MKTREKAQANANRNMGPLPDSGYAPAFCYLLSHSVLLLSRLGPRRRDRNLRDPSALSQDDAVRKGYEMIGTSNHLGWLDAHIPVGNEEMSCRF